MVISTKIRTIALILLLVPLSTLLFLLNYDLISPIPYLTPASHIAGETFSIFQVLQGPFTCYIVLKMCVHPYWRTKVNRKTWFVALGSLHILRMVYLGLCIWDSKRGKGSVRRAVTVGSEVVLTTMVMVGIVMDWEWDGGWYNRYLNRYLDVVNELGILDEKKMAVINEKIDLEKGARVET